MAVRPFAYYCEDPTGFVRCNFHDLGSDSQGFTTTFCKRTPSQPPEICTLGALTSSVANAINFAVNNGAKIVNLSLGAEYDTNRSDPSYLNALQSATSRGTFVAMAAGNAGKPYSSTYVAIPGRYGKDVRGAMTVGSIDVASGAQSTFTSYGNTFVEIAAPGAMQSRTGTTPLQGLYSTMARIVTAQDRGCPNASPAGYGCLSGTSQATPLVAGAAAVAAMIYRQRYGVEPSAATLEDLLELSSTKNPSLASFFKSGQVLNLGDLEATVNSYCP
jgi:subtilisin family serine protease